MTVSEIVKDLLEYNMITKEAAIVLLSAESKANMFNRKDENTNQVFQSYHRIPNTSTTSPYYISSTTNSTKLSAEVTKLLKEK